MATPSSPSPVETIPFETHSGEANIARATVEWEFRVPEEVTRESSVLIAPGYFAKEGIYDGVADYLAGQGIATATYKAVRNQGLLSGLHPKHFKHPGRLVCQSAWGAIRGIRQRENIKAPTSIFTIVGHSMGGPTAVDNARQHPESFDGIILIDSAGVENHSARILLPRLLDLGAREVVPAVWEGDVSPRDAVKHTINGIVYFASNPLRTAGEGLYVASTNVKPHVGELEAKGIKVAAIVSRGDKLLHAQKSLAAARKLIDIWIMNNASLGHLGPLRQPAEYGAAVVQVLDHFDEQPPDELVDDQFELAA